MSDNLFLFANNNQGTAEDLGYYRLYNMKIEGDSEGVESGIDYVDYIYGDKINDCKLDTGLPFTKSNKYIMGINIIDSNSYSTFTGGFNYNWVTNRLEYGGLNVYPTWTNGGEGYFKSSWTTVGNEIVFDNGVLSVNGVSASNVNTPFTSDGTGNNQIINLKYAKLRYFRVYNKSGTLIQELLPCIDNEGISCVYDTVAKKYIYASNGTISYKKKLRNFQPVLDNEGTPCMYDLVTETFFYNQGAGEFSYGIEELDGATDTYTPISYIETNGTQYIDTGVVPTDNTDIDMVCRAVDKLHYIEDGLILRLDAIDNTRDGHNASSTVWEDLSGNGLDFNLTDVTVNDTTMAFNGTSSVGTLQNIELWRNIVNNTEQYTVEVCFKFSDGQSYNPIISTNLGNVNVSSFVETIQVGQQSVGLLMKDNEYGGLFFTISCDANDIIYHVNTKLRETLDKGDYIYPPTTDVFWIGARLTGQHYHFTGELCSIRIYNKKLTDEERLYNHSSDVIRYGVVTDVSVINTDRNYLMNDFYTDTTYKYKEIDTTVEPNLTASEGATLTLGSTYISYLSEEEIEQAIKNGWIIQ